jgi:hypothetical protein
MVPAAKEYSVLAAAPQVRQRTTYTVTERNILRVTLPFSGEVLIEMSPDTSPLLSQRKQFCHEKISHTYKRYLQWTIRFTKTKARATGFWRKRMASPFTHLVVCLTTGPKPLPKRALHIGRSRVSSLK